MFLYMFEFAITGRVFKSMDFDVREVDSRLLLCKQLSSYKLGY